MTRSSGTRQPRVPTRRNRGSSSGTLTRAKRSSPVSGSRTKTPRLSESPEMYGNGWPCPTPSGVSTGNTSVSKSRSSSNISSSSRSSIAATMIPASASAGRSSRFHSRDWRAVSSSTRARISASASSGVRPSGERTDRPASACSARPATRTMKKSSRLDEKNLHTFTRSSSATVGSSASSSTRAAYSSQESSRLRRRDGARSAVAVAVIGIFMLSLCASRVGERLVSKW